MSRVRRRGIVGVGAGVNHGGWGWPYGGGSIREDLKEVTQPEDILRKGTPGPEMSAHPAVGRGFGRVLGTDQIWKDIYCLEPTLRSSGSGPGGLPKLLPPSPIVLSPSIHFILLSLQNPYCFPPMMISEIFVFVSTIDVKSWLVMFGFQLSNIIPGFPRAQMYFVPPPYELSESQASESGQVSRGSCQEHNDHHRALGQTERHGSRAHVGRGGEHWSWV